MDAAPLVPMMQQALDAQAIEQYPVLRKLTALEIIHQADGREHQWIAGQVVDVGIALEAIADLSAVLRTRGPRLLLRLVTRETDRGTPMAGVFRNLGLPEVE